MIRRIRMFTAVTCLAAIGLLAGCGSVNKETVTLATTPTVTVTGPENAAGRLTLRATDISRQQAETLGRFQPNTMWVQGVSGEPADVNLRSSLTYTFQLPDPALPGWTYDVLSLQSGLWLSQRAAAVTGADGRSASVTLRVWGALSLVRPAVDWARGDAFGYTFVTRTTQVPTTSLSAVDVLADGARDSEPVIEAVMAATGRDRTGAVALLASYRPERVRVLRTQQATWVVRYYGPDATPGRWFAPVSGRVDAPDTARQRLALPDSNKAVECLLGRVQPGAVMVEGLCADMTHDPVFGPYATGGGQQLYIPAATRWAVDHPEWNPECFTVAAQLRRAELLDGERSRTRRSHDRSILDARF